MNAENKDTAEGIQEAQDATTEKVLDLMNKPMEFFNQGRAEDEVDMIAEVRDRLFRAGLGEKLPECFDNNRFIIDAHGRNSHAQQYCLTRYFSTQFMAAQGDTGIERYSLIYEVRADEWLKVFDNVILPAVINHDLPVRL